MRPARKNRKMRELLLIGIEILKDDFAYLTKKVDMQSRYNLFSKQQLVEELLQIEYNRKEAEENEEQKKCELDEAEKKEDQMRCELEVLEFIAYFVGAGIPPPPIPSIWHKERNLMQQSMHTIILAKKRKQPELLKKNKSRSFMDIFRSIMMR